MECWSKRWKPCLATPINKEVTAVLVLVVLVYKQTMFWNHEFSLVMIAQLIERGTEDPKVRSSNPPCDDTRNKVSVLCLFLCIWVPMNECKLFTPLFSLLTLPARPCDGIRTQADAVVLSFLVDFRLIHHSEIEANYLKTGTKPVWAHSGWGSNPEPFVLWA